MGTSVYNAPESAIRFFATCSDTLSTNSGGTWKSPTRFLNDRTCSTSRYRSRPDAMSLSAPRLNFAFAVPAKTSSMMPFLAPTSVFVFELCFPSSTR